MKINLRIFCLFLLFAGCTTKPTSWVAIGDSITYLNDHVDETGKRVTKGYMTQVVEQLPYVHYVNKGFNGWTAVQVAEKIDELGIEKADIYSVFLGTNDWWHGNRVGTLDDYKNNTGTKTFAGALRVIVNKLKSLNKDADIILITPMQRVDFVYVNDMKNNAWGSYRDKDGQSLASFADVELAIGELENIRVLDLYNKSEMTHESLVHFKRLKDPQTGAYKNYGYPDFEAIPFNPETDQYPYPPEAIGMTYDGLHPSDKGNAVIAKMLVGEMRSMR
jgi:lysophospholipase L1-like esterase